MNTKKFLILIMIFVISGLSACASPAAAPQASEPITLTVMTHDSFAVTEDLIREFEAKNQIKLVFLKSGDTGAALNKAILSKSSPLADVFYGFDSTFLTRALEADLFEAYSSPLLDSIPASYKLDPGSFALPVDYGDVCINYDKAYFEERNLTMPGQLEDLTRPEYQGLLVMENPATSSPGLAFLLASVAHFGPEGYLDFWASMRENGMTVVNDWETAYYTNFSGSSGKGAQPMVVSYGSSPVAEVIFASEPLEESPTASLTGSGMCYRQIEFVGILKGTQQRAAAEKFVDFMLDVPFQEDMPEQMFVYPVNSNAVLPDDFVKHAQVPENPASLSPADISKNREQWIEDWTGTVLR